MTPDLSLRRFSPTRFDKCFAKNSDNQISWKSVWTVWSLRVRHIQAVRQRDGHAKGKVRHGVDMGSSFTSHRTPNNDQAERGLSPPPPSREVSQVTEPRDRRSGDYVTAQIVAICRTSKLSTIDFSTATKLPATFELHAVYFQNITNEVRARYLGAHAQCHTLRYGSDGGQKEPHCKRSVRREQKKPRRTVYV